MSVVKAMSGRELREGHLVDLRAALDRLDPDGRRDLRARVARLGPDGVLALAARGLGAAVPRAGGPGWSEGTGP